MIIMIYDKVHQHSYTSLCSKRAYLVKIKWIKHISPTCSVFFGDVTSACVFVLLIEGDVCLFSVALFTVACPYASYYKTQNIHSRPGYSLASNK